MVLDTHCEPTGSLRTGELVPPNISLANCTVSIPAGGLGHGNIRGVIVYLHGLVETFPTVPYGFPSDTTPGFANDIQSFVTAVVADGWIVVGVPHQEDFYQGVACIGIQNDISNDPGFGSGYLNSTTREWDHILNFIAAQFVPGMPVVPVGFSWGAMKTLQIVKAEPTTCLGYIAHEPATILSNAAPNYTKPANFGPLNCSGLTFPLTSLFGVTVPGMIGYGTNDAAVGYDGGSPPGAGSIGQSVGSISSLVIQSTAGLVIGPNVAIFRTGNFTAPYATLAFTGTSGGNTLTGVSLLRGSGTIASSDLVFQSFTENLSGTTGGFVTANVTADHHEWTTTDAATYAAYVASTLDPLAPKVF